ncbi:MAG: quinohemoprotein amine dehydrogenase subunit beta, partial [Sphingomonadales bacterium]
REYKIDAPGATPTTIVSSPDGRIAYVVMSYKHVVGIDLLTGDKVFEHDLSHKPDERVINMGLTISADGSELFSYELPTRMGIDHYEVQPARLSVYSTSAEDFGDPVRIFTDVPRRIQLMMTGTDGAYIYALGFDLYKMDAQTGEIVDTYPVMNWERENLSQPDLLNFWPMSEQSGMFSTLLFSVRTDLSPDDMAAYPTDGLALDLATGEVELTKLDVPPQVLFTATISPDRKHLYAVYTTVLKFDREDGALLAQGEVDHSYYQVNVSGDGTEIYLGGTFCDIAIRDAETLEQTGAVSLPGCPSMGAAAMRMIQLDLGE